MMKLLSLFSGIGAFESALKNIDIEYETINFSEIYKPSILSYCKIHNESKDKNLGDITKVDPKTLEDFDLMSYGFPCQCYSIMGKRKGFDDIERGGLFHESMRIVKEKKPKYLIAENVTGLLSIDEGRTFKIILDYLNKLGYKNYYKVLNSSYFDIPQNRNRIFIVSIRKDIKQNFSFPIYMKKTNKKVIDIIDSKIKDRLISKDMIQYFDKKYFTNKYTNGKLFDGCNDGIFNSGWQIHRIYTIHDISPTLTTTNTTPHFYEIGGVLVGKERMRLQGFTDADYDKIRGITTEEQIGYMTGNSITINILESIFKNLFDKEHIEGRKELLSNWI